MMGRLVSIEIAAGCVDEAGRCKLRIVLGRDARGESVSLLFDSETLVTSADWAAGGRRDKKKKKWKNTASLGCHRTSRGATRHSLPGAACCMLGGRETSVAFHERSRGLGTGTELKTRDGAGANPPRLLLRAGRHRDSVQCCKYECNAVEQPGDRREPAGDHHPAGGQHELACDG